MLLFNNTILELSMEINLKDKDKDKDNSDKYSFDSNQDYEEIPAPESTKFLVKLPFDPEIYLDQKTMTRWRETPDGLVRDYSGEQEWEQMGSYVGKTYQQVFQETYNRYVLFSKPLSGDDQQGKLGS